jgi:hypothetical protein
MVEVSRDIEHARERLQAEVNKNKLVIDRSVFVKTEEEKLALKKAKSVHKLASKAKK